ncbi:carbonic anhydrase [Thecamonas trahens ATCC 50062]|uniref:Carbonic anhydrase n=1 Tax=Thecamonas trahens ATCC 50062 TaxID=461836 RepID=A0A0L0D855_THETB|nr:carbonic anhydrase [Thecamonas trahens ATCC 50062]KNC47483.1 carbonic anhydrase [Thecamonas trahens ATCC 50062]|eukprot:XP_013759419.1 carbonic anhydrase [Thecamonas trahens ATCC 50062]
MKQMMKTFAALGMLLLLAGMGSAASCEYSYDAPEEWGTVCNAPLCNQTMGAQSPIDLMPTATVATAAAIHPIYGSASGLEVENKGHTIQVSYNASTMFRIESTALGATRKVLQLHFHTPSEHTVNGMHYPLEMHVVHADASNNLAVLGIFFETSSMTSPLLQSVVANADDLAAKGDKAMASLDLTEVSKAGLSYWSYPGSLTTPPCSEGVSWMVLQSPLKASQAQIDAIEAIIGKSNRPTQPLAGRSVSSYRAPAAAAMSSNSMAAAMAADSDDDDSSATAGAALSGVNLALLVIMMTGLTVAVVVFGIRLQYITRLLLSLGAEVETAKPAAAKKSKGKGKKKGTLFWSDSTDTDEATDARTGLSYDESDEESS